MQKRFSFPPLPRTALAIAAAAALALSGCAGSSGSGTPAESYAASGQENEGRADRPARFLETGVPETHQNAPVRWQHRTMHWKENQSARKRRRMYSSDPRSS